MFWNFVVHVVAGILWRNSLFTFDWRGVIMCVLMALVVQGLDMFRIYRQTKERIDGQPPYLRDSQMATFKKRAPIIMPQLYVGKVLFYAAVTFIAAAIVHYGYEWASVIVAVVMIYLFLGCAWIVEEYNLPIAKRPYYAVTKNIPVTILFFLMWPVAIALSVSKYRRFTRSKRS